MSLPTNPDDEIWYIAKRRLLIPNGPNKVPSSTRVEVGERFVLDGDEPIDIAALLRQGAVTVYRATPANEAFIEAERRKRQERAERPKLRRNRG